ncbi:tetratricopeptide repeat protein [Nitratireductor pacificus]|uniref:tetratricopeptide repeat protein n=1 Tax=Nitratireductor pacificus TaxID=1231180 RepID=UPI00178C4631|nr:tetratricopeptide repeat protein [Nitratireductor pacificus]
MSKKVKAKVQHALRPEQRLAVEAKELLSKWDLEAALAKADEALTLKPNLQKALQLRVTILSNLGRLEDARRAVRILGGLYPLDPSARRQMRALELDAPPVSRSIAMHVVEQSGWRASTISQAAQYLYDGEKFEDALDFCVYGMATVSRITDRKRRTTVRNNLIHCRALSLESLHRYEEAIATYEQLFPSGKDNLRATMGVARCSLELNRAEHAETMLRAGYAEQKDPWPFSPLNLDALQAQRKIKESYELYRKKPISAAISKYFNVHVKPSEINIVSGYYRDKSALLLSEGGPGDEFRLCTTYSDLSRLFGRLTITCDPRLTTIMRRTFPDIEFLPTARHRRELVRDMPDRKTLTDATLFQCVSDQAIVVGKDCDLVCSVLDCLADIRPNPETFEGKGGVLKPLPHLADDWRRNIGNNCRPQVGIAWRSLLQTVARNRHYLTVDDLRGLSALKNVDFWLLQPGATEEEISQLSSFVSLKIPEGLDLLDDFEGQLAMTSTLDAVLSPFTTSGELAGAAGVPTILLSTTSNTMWRRNKDGTDIWRPNVTIASGVPIHDRVLAMQQAIETIDALPRTMQVQSA